MNTTKYLQLPFKYNTKPVLCVNSGQRDTSYNHADIVTCWTCCDLL